MRILIVAKLMISLSLSICGLGMASEDAHGSNGGQTADLSKDSVLPALKLQTGSAGGIQVTAFSRDASLIATASGAEVILWDVATGRELRRFSQPGGPVKVLRFGSGRETLLVSGPGTLALWDTATGSMGRPCPGLPGPVVAAEFATASATVIAACVANADGTGTPAVPSLGNPSHLQRVHSFHEFDPRTGERSALWSTEANRVAISEDCSRVVVIRSDRNQRVEVRDARTGTIRHAWALAPRSCPTDPCTS